MHVNGGSYLGRTEPNSGMKACRFPVICHAGNNRKLPVMSVTGTGPTGNEYPDNRNALLATKKKRQMSPNLVSDFKTL